MPEDHANIFIVKDTYCLIHAPCKVIQDSLGFRIQRLGFLTLCTGFRIPRAETRIPKPRIADSTRKNFPRMRITSLGATFTTFHFFISLFNPAFRKR